jgi:hypothetical protein
VLIHRRVTADKNELIRPDTQPIANPVNVDQFLIGLDELCKRAQLAGRPQNRRFLIFLAIC